MKNNLWKVDDRFNLYSEVDSREVLGKEEVILLWGRVSVVSTTARGSSSVGSTEHPEFRSYLSDKSERSRVPYRIVTEPDPSRTPSGEYQNPAGQLHDYGNNEAS